MSTLIAASPHVGQDLPPETVLHGPGGGLGQIWVLLPEGARWEIDLTHRWRASTCRISEQGPEGPWGMLWYNVTLNPSLCHVVELGGPWDEQSNAALT